MNWKRRGSGGRRPGEYAQEKFERMRNDWRRRNLRRVGWGLWSVIAAGVLGSGLPGAWAWMSGAVAGGCLAFWLSAREFLPAHITRWEQGAEGERMTARELGKLGPRWRVSHDLQTFGRSNVDHFVVGPGGAYLLDSKHWYGTVEIVNGEAVVTPPDDEAAAWTATGLARRMRAGAFKNKEAIQQLTGVKTWVQSVVVLWCGSFPQRVVEADKVTYVAGEALAEWLQSRPDRLPEQKVIQLAAVTGS